MENLELKEAMLFLNRCLLYEGLCGLKWLSYIIRWLSFLDKTECQRGFNDTEKMRILAGLWDWWSHQTTKYFAANLFPVLHPFFVNIIVLIVRDALLHKMFPNSVKLVLGSCSGPSMCENDVSCSLNHSFQFKLNQSWYVGRRSCYQERGGKKIIQKYLGRQLTSFFVHVVELNPDHN